MFSFLKSSRTGKLKKKRKQLLAEAVRIQRSGDLRAYARKMEEVEAMERQIQDLQG